MWMAFVLAGLMGFSCERRSFLDQRAANPTVLTVHGPAPQRFENEAPPSGVQETHYLSGTLSLRAWYAVPANASAAKKVPALVYFHGGYAFGGDDFEAGRAFLEAGFAVLMPTLRGENGNPGEHELFWGELDDARAAISWLQAQPEIDGELVFVFGHSAGGVISGLVSLCETPRVRLSGSAGGTYDERLFTAMEAVPFDVRVKKECELRLFAPNAGLIRQRHVAYVGAEDVLATLGAATAKDRSTGSLLLVKQLPGNHFTSLTPALADFLDRTQRMARK